MQTRLIHLREKKIQLCARGYTLSLLLTFWKDLGHSKLIPKGLGTQVPNPVAPLRPCCGKTWQSKRLLSILIVQSRISGNLLSSLVIYTATNPDAILTYKRSNMVLAVHSNASYLSKPLVRSQVGGHFFCSSNINDPHNNGAILNISNTLKAIMSSTAKAKLGALYVNTHEAIPMQQVFKETGHKQPPTPIQTNNSTAHGMVTNNIQPGCTKAMNMRFLWLNCRDSQGQFRYYRRPGPDNQGNFWSNFIVLLITSRCVPLF
jgi:hypothetical protein